MKNNLKDFNWEELNEMFSPKQMQKQAQINGGRTAGKLAAENGTVNKAGKISAKKQWEENRDGELIKSKKGGESARDNKKGVHSLSKKQLSNAGKKGYSKGLGKLSKKEKMKIIKKACMASRDVNSNLTKEDVIFMRKHFIPRHPEFGVVAFSKKYNTSECGIRNAIKGRTFKDV